MANIVLILGGVRSGKSRFAQQLAAEVGGQEVLFVATAQAGDTEMVDRIQRHREERPDAWETLEAPLQVAGALDAAPDRHRVVLIDCLTLLVSNVLLQGDQPTEAADAERRMRGEIESLVEASQRRRGTVIMVSGEVGLGVVPESRLGRLYRDLLGWANQMVASRAQATYFMVAGFPLEVRSQATTLERAAAACMSGADPVAWSEECLPS